MNNNGWSFVADIVRSTKGSTQEQRDKMEWLQECCLRLNDVFKETFRIDVEVSGGDSLQGVFYKASDAFLYGRLLDKLMYPENIRFGISKGEIVETRVAQSNNTGGTAYVNAQNALKEAKDKKLLCKIDIENLSVIEHLFIDSTSLLKGTLNKQQREVDLIVEVLYPFESSGMKNQNLQKVVETIVRFKMQSKHWKNSKMKLVFMKQYFDQVKMNKKLKAPSDVDSILVDLNDNPNQQGMINKVQKYIGTTQQNVSDKIERSRIKEIRLYDLKIHDLLMNVSVK